MDIDSEIKQLKEAEEEQSENPATFFCCLPRNTSSATFCGTVLLLIGGLWLLNTLGVIAARLSLIWPLLLICLGLFWLIHATQRQA